VTVLFEDTYRCEECGVEISVPQHIPEDARAVIARFVRESPQVQAILLFRTYSRGSSIIACKNIMKHVSAPGDNCHHCWADLPGKGAVICTACRALNLNW